MTLRHEVDLEVVGELGVAGLAEEVDRLSERQVGLAGAAVEAVEHPPGLLDDLEGLGQLAEGLDGGVAGVVGSGVGVVDGHGPTLGRLAAARGAPCRSGAVCGKVRGRWA